MSTTCLYTTLKNTSGARRTFGFIPPHGKTLDDAETVTIFGNILDYLRDNARSRKAFETAVDNGDITLVETPSPMLLDATTGNSRILELDNGTLDDIAPCFPA